MVNDIQKLIAIANKLANPLDSESLKAGIYKLQIENLQLKEENVNVVTELRQKNEWAKSKKMYKQCQTKYKAVMYVKRKQTKSDVRVFYCPACFAHQLIVPLQPVPFNKIANLGHTADVHVYCPHCKEILFKGSDI